MNNPRFVQVGSDFELEATTLFVEAFRAAYLAGQLQADGDWHVGVEKGAQSRMAKVVESRVPKKKQ